MYRILDYFAVYPGEKEIMQSSISNSFDVFPNPCSASANLIYTNHDIGFLTVDIFDIAGTKIKSVFIGAKKTGSCEEEIDMSDIPSGVYFFVLKTTDGIQTKKIIKM